MNNTTEKQLIDLRSMSFEEASRLVPEFNARYHNAAQLAALFHFSLGHACGLSSWLATESIEHGIGNIIAEVRLDSSLNLKEIEDLAVSLLCGDAGVRYFRKSSDFSSGDGLLARELVEVLTPTVHDDHLWWHTDGWTAFGSNDTERHHLWKTLEYRAERFVQRHWSSIEKIADAIRVAQNWSQ